MAVSAPEILQQAAATLAQRGEDYDAAGGERSMAHTVAIFQVITGVRLTERQGWEFMLALKLARGQQGKPKADTYVDLAGYAALAGECALESVGATDPCSDFPLLDDPARGGS